MSIHAKILEENYLKQQEMNKRYFIGMVKAGKYDEYINFCSNNHFDTCQVSINDLKLMINIIKGM